jgi:5'-nucleotidase
MHTPRRTLVALAAPAVALTLGFSVALAPSAGSTASPERKAGTSGAKVYHQLAKKKKNFVKLDLLAINDFHGNLQPPTGSSGQINNTKAGGAAFLASLLHRQRKASRAAGATPLTVAAGDLIGASPLVSAAFHDEPTIKAMNEMHLDVSSVGNHEFDEGVNELIRMEKGGCLNDGPNGANGQNSCPGDQGFEGSDWPYLGANVFWKNRAGHPRPTVFRPYKIFRVDKQKVAFIGMTLEDTDTIVSQAGIVDVDFRDEVETANALVPKLRKKGVKSIIVLLHEGVTPSDATAYNDCTGVTGAGLAIAQNLAPQIDAVVSGHTHQPYNCVVKDPKGRPRLFTSASSFGRMVTKLHFLIDPKTRDIVRPAAFASNIINANAEGQKQSTKLNKLISVYNTLVQPIANAVVGHLGTANTCSGGAVCVTRAPDRVTTPPTPTFLDGGDDSPLGNLIADAQKADPTVVRNGVAPVIALMNPGGIRADLVENAAGDVTYGAAFTVQPFNNFVVSMDLTGAQIKALLNEQWNGKNEAGDAGNKILQVSGLTYTWDRTLALQSNTNALVGDVLFDADGDPATTGDQTALVDTQTYRVVANNFLSDGGDNFATFKAGTNKLVGGLDIDSLVNYLKAHDPYNVTLNNRIKSVN